MLTFLLAGFVCLGLIYLVVTRFRRPAPIAFDAPRPPTLGPPAALVIRLPAVREWYGALYLRDQAGNVLEGPFDAIGRSADVLAERSGNLDRLPTLPFGDTPLGRYRIIRIEPAPTQPLQLGSFGPHGRIILGPLAGEAILAEAAGRFEIAIQGGRPGSDGGLRPTDGGVRVEDVTIWTLLNALRHSIGLECGILPWDKDDDALADWGNDDRGDGLIDFGEEWDPAWPDPTIPAGDFAPDIGPDLTGIHPSGQGEQVVAAAMAGGVAGAATAEFLAGGDNAYAP